MIISEAMELLKNQHLVMEEKLVRSLVAFAANSSQSAEVRIEGKEELFYTRLLPASPNLAQSTIDTILILPLEPPGGNIAIRNANKIRMEFMLGYYSLQTNVEFRGIIQNQGIPSLVLSFPRILQVTPRRKLYRYPLTNKTPCAVELAQRREKSIFGRVLDIHMEGLCLNSRCNDVGPDPASYVRLSVSPEMEGFPSFSILGIACYRLTERHSGDTTCIRKRFGVHFQNILDYSQLKKFVEAVFKQDPTQPSPL